MSQPAHSESDAAPILFRPGRAEDNYAVFCVFEEALADLSWRLGIVAPTSWHDPAALARTWARRAPLYAHLAESADQFWLAERDGKALGFARAVLRDGLQQLTELFVVPRAQSAGVGRELLAHAFAPRGAARRCIIASPEMGAQSLYMRAGVYPQFPIYYFSRAPQPCELPGDLTFEPIEATPAALEALAMIDRAVIGHRRDSDHAWLIGDRSGFFYRRDGQLLGYGYTHPQSGPFALLDPADFPAVLAHAEAQAALAGQEQFGLEVPMLNRTAAEYLLARGYRIDRFTEQFLSDQPFGCFAQYIVTSPPLLL